MILNAVLTVGWEDDVDHPQSALLLHRAAAAAVDGYANALKRLIATAPVPLTLYGLEQLFRRRVGGYRALRQFLGQLTHLAAPGTGAGRGASKANGAVIRCRIDVFAYGFLAAAGRLGGVLAEGPGGEGPFRSLWPHWQQVFNALARLEDPQGRWTMVRQGGGQGLPEALGARYGALRQLLGHPAGRDEGRLLATLLINGPSTRPQLAKDLGLATVPPPGVMAGLVNAGAVILGPDERHRIPQEALPVVAFALARHWGIDPLGALPAPREAREGKRG